MYCSFGQYQCNYHLRPAVWRILLNVRWHHSPVVCKIFQGSMIANDLATFSTFDKSKIPWVSNVDEDSETAKIMLSGPFPCSYMSDYADQVA